MSVQREVFFQHVGGVFIERTRLRRPISGQDEQEQSDRQGTRRSRQEHSSH